jgi:hypothetical protein
VVFEGVVPVPFGIWKVFWGWLTFPLSGGGLSGNPLNQRDVES